MLKSLGVAVAIATAIAVSLGAAAFSLYGSGEGAKLSLSIVFGAVFGFILQRSRFCFFCMFRDFGIMAGALSGWVFGAAVFIGIAVTLRGMRWASP